MNTGRGTFLTKKMQSGSKMLSPSAYTCVCACVCVCVTCVCICVQGLLRPKFNQATKRVRVYNQGSALYRLDSATWRENPPNGPEVKVKGEPGAFIGGRFFHLVLNLCYDWPRFIIKNSHCLWLARLFPLLQYCMKSSKVEKYCMKRRLAGVFPFHHSRALIGRRFIHSISLVLWSVGVFPFHHSRAVIGRRFSIPSFLCCTWFAFFYLIFQVKGQPGRAADLGGVLYSLCFWVILYCTYTIYNITII